MSVPLHNEIWGTFSVKDHCHKRPFIADLMLYDRLVIPIPPKGDADEYERWRTNNWKPARLNACLDRLGDLAVTVPWDAERQRTFKSKQAAAANLDPFRTTSVQLKLEHELNVPRERIPKGVAHVRPIAAYQSHTEFARDLHVDVKKEREDAGGQLAAVLARRFLVPDDPKLSDLDMLEKAVTLAGNDEFREKRSTFHQWLEKVMTQGLPERDAVVEMDRYVKEYEAVLKQFRIRKLVKYGFLVTKVGLYTAAAAGAAAVSPLIAPVGGAAILLAEYGLVQRTPDPQPPQHTPAAMFYAVRKYFGWK
jgi:hypothetical protein